jgi:hypothetical protein
LDLNGTAKERKLANGTDLFVFYFLKIGRFGFSGFIGFI